MTTGDRIKEARIAAGLTQSQLAEKVGVKFSAIHKYETGMIVNLKRETIAALASALNVKPSWLMCMDEDEATQKVKELSRIADDLSPQDIEYLLTTARALKARQESQDNS